jgi:hypothetical protein
VGILRIPEGFDINKIPDESEANDDDPDLEETDYNSDDEEGRALIFNMHADLYKKHLIKSITK